MADAAEAHSLAQEDLPEVELVRYVTRSENLDVLAECMTDQGFPPAASQGGLLWEVPPEQEYDLGIAQYVCTGRYPIDPRLIQPLDRAQLEIAYDWLVEETIPCIEDLGYTVPAPPSLESYLADDGWWEGINEVERQVVADMSRWESFG